MRIAVMGAGGIGGYFGARLAKAGEDISFIGRGEHLRAMQQDGLRLEKSRWATYTSTRSEPQKRRPKSDMWMSLSLPSSSTDIETCR